MLEDTQCENLLSSANLGWNWASHIVLGTCSWASAKRCATLYLTSHPCPLGSLNPCQGHGNGDCKARPFSSKSDRKESLVTCQAWALYLNFFLYKLFIEV